jgi:hypothetical protein
MESSLVKMENSLAKSENNLAMLDCMKDWLVNMEKSVNMMEMLGYKMDLMVNNVKPMKDSSVDLMEDNAVMMDCMLGFE